MENRVKKRCEKCGFTMYVLPQHVKTKKLCDACQRQKSVDYHVEYNRKKRARIKAEKLKAAMIN